MNEIITLSVREKELTNQLEELEQAIKGMEENKITLMKTYTKLQSWYNLQEIKSAADYDDTFNCESLEGDILFVKMKGVLPFIRKEHRLYSNDYFRKLRDYYTPLMIKALQSFDASYERAFILIIQYFPDFRIRDLDNQFKAFIFNALRATQITKDDNWQNIFYMDAAFLDENNPRTEIYVSSQDDMINTLKFMPNRYEKL